MPACFYPEDTLLDILVLIDQDLTDAQKISAGLSRIGSTGYGRDASIGFGRFSVVGSPKELSIDHSSRHQFCYTLSPCVPGTGDYDQEAYFTPFTRFGRHGDVLAVGSNPFKAPVIMADQGAVFRKRPDNGLKLYTGRALSELSLSKPETVGQGYSIVVPLNLQHGLNSGIKQ
ncbi:MAG: hypothetical protein D6719_08620 [Candidatus Dadabacteria bacterium]|nr:MAG: hypothetical protein D6719_08620 [Candidatus Dadabacteria bacterium]